MVDADALQHDPLGILAVEPVVLRAVVEDGKSADIPEVRRHHDQPRCGLHAVVVRSRKRHPQPGPPLSLLDEKISE